MRLTKNALRNSPLVRVLIRAIQEAEPSVLPEDAAESAIGATGMRRVLWMNLSDENRRALIASAIAQAAKRERDAG